MDSDSQLPALDAGVTYLDDADAPTALYRLVGRCLASAGGPAYWVDARNAAVPGALREHAPGRTGRSIRVARAFTGYQHHELVRSLPGEVPARTSLVVAPNVAALYAEDDVPGYEADAMLDATLQYLQAVATAVDVPVVVTTSDGGGATTGDGAGATANDGGENPSRAAEGTGAYAERVRAAADRELDAERTRAGLRFDGAGFETDAYWHDWGFQTTIPYWVDLLGAVAPEREQAVVDAVGV